MYHVDFFQLNRNADKTDRNALQAGTFAASYHPTRRQWANTPLGWGTAFNTVLFDYPEAPKARPQTGKVAYSTRHMHRRRLQPGALLDEKSVYAVRQRPNSVPEHRDIPRDRWWYESGREHSRVYYGNGAKDRVFNDVKLTDPMAPHGRAPYRTEQRHFSRTPMHSFQHAYLLQDKDAELIPQPHLRTRTSFFKAHHRNTSPGESGGIPGSLTYSASRDTRNSKVVPHQFWGPL